jgi:hypothetical protein
MSSTCIAEDHYVSKKFWEELIAYFPWYDTDHIQNNSSNKSYIVCVFVATVIFLPSRCLAMVGDTHTDTKTDGRDLCSRPLRWVQVPSFIKMGSAIRNSIDVMHTHRQRKDRISLFYFLNTENRPKRQLWFEHGLTLVKILFCFYLIVIL